MPSAGDVIARALVGGLSRAVTTFMGREVVVTAPGVGVSAEPLNLTVEQMWRTQPHLRTVVDFLARNVAHLGLHSFRTDGNDRVRDRDSLVASLMRQPNQHMTTYELVYDLVGNLALHNRAYWFVYESTDTPSGWAIQPFPASWVKTSYGTYWEPKHYVVSPPDSPDKAVKFKPENVLAFEGWNPLPGKDSSPVETLRLTLEEQYHARKHRTQVWRRAGRVGGYITRPVDAPRWDNQDRRRFLKMFEEFTREGSRTGGTPIFEEGMRLETAEFNSANAEWAESVKLSLVTVAQVFQVNPVMVGVLDNANYSNAKEFSKSLYTNTLGPLIRQIEQRLNTFLLPMVGVDPGSHLLEFNIEEKLRGSFEEQAAVASSAVGAPYMTRNELRRMNNLPAIEGGDALVTPLNLDTSNVSRETDGGSDVSDDVSRETSGNELPAAAKAVLEEHGDRARRVIASKGDSVRVRERLARELADDLAGFPELAEKSGVLSTEYAGLSEKVLESGDVSRET
nr:MAG TPA: portal protein [Caudoviricetes sp.]